MGMTRSMGRELGKYGITVNAVAPGSVWTSMFAGIPEELKQKKLKDIPVRRFADPSEIANVYAFLASEEASYVNGTTLGDAANAVSDGSEIKYVYSKAAHFSSSRGDFSTAKPKICNTPPH